MAQRDENPFRFSDTNKRYHTYDYYLRHAFGGKCVKIPLDGGFTCPNIDGKCGVGGCIYCSGRGSGDFAASPLLSVREQFETVRARIGAKWSTARVIPYFQAHTNTYAPVLRLRSLYEEALAQEGVVGMNIATRADCLEDDVIELLDELSKRTVLTVELGLQSVHDTTAAAINRGHTFADFLRGYQRLRRLAPHVRIGVHLIFGLIGEKDEKMVESAKTVGALLPDEIKLHLLYVVEGTKMAEIYKNGGYFPMERAAYVDVVVRAIEHLPPQVVLGRLTGDGAPHSLLAPEWSRKKLCVLNEIDKKFYSENTYQGKALLNSFVK